jgi:hypothetical protein
MKMKFRKQFIKEKNRFKSNLNGGIAPINGA